MKEKKITWTKSGRESAKREADLYDMPEKAATDEQREEGEDEATCLLEEMRENVVAAQRKMFRGRAKSMQRSA